VSRRRGQHLDFSLLWTDEEFDVKLEKAIKDALYKIIKKSKKRPVTPPEDAADFDAVSVH
jgi:hypothetical protein